MFLYFSFNCNALEHDHIHSHKISFEFEYSREKQGFLAFLVEILQIIPQGIRFLSSFEIFGTLRYDPVQKFLVETVTNIFICEHSFASIILVGLSFCVSLLRGSMSRQLQLQVVWQWPTDQRPFQYQIEYRQSLQLVLEYVSAFFSCPSDIKFDA